METAQTPQQKLEYLKLCVNIISQGLMKFSTRKDAPGADDILPVFTYVLIMSSPKMLHSNLKYKITPLIDSYIAAVKNLALVMDEGSYCYTQTITTVRYLEQFTGAGVGMKDEEFMKRVETEAAKRGLKNDLPDFVLTSAKK